MIGRPGLDDFKGGRTRISLGKPESWTEGCTSCSDTHLGHHCAIFSPFFRKAGAKISRLDVYNGVAHRIDPMLPSRCRFED
jgi:hypothetical protein